MEDLESMITPKTDKKEASKTPAPATRQICTRAKAAAPKKRKVSSSDEGWFNKGKLIVDTVNEVMEDIKDEYDNAIKGFQQSLVELRTSVSARDKTIIKMKKEHEEQLADVKAQADETIAEGFEGAKTSALKSLLQARIKIVEEALDPSFDKSSWELTKWKNALADITDGDEEPVQEMMNAGGVAGASGGGADVEGGSVEGGEKQVGDEGHDEKS